MKKYLKSLLLLSITILFAACSKPGDDPKIELSAPSVPVAAADIRTSFKIEANTPWMIINPHTELVISPVSGNSNATISVTLPVNTKTTAVNYTITVKQTGTSGISKSIIIAQAAANNAAPTAPVLSSPANNATDVSLRPTLSWATSTDANGDAISYELMISEDNTTFASKAIVQTGSYAFSDQLPKGKKYYWKVIARDPSGASTESAVFAFTTDNSNVHPEGSVKEAEINRSKDNAVNIIIMGDGFIREDLKPGGAYDQAMDRAREAFFAIEPYKAYRSDFNVYYVYSESRERGATYGWGYDGSTQTSFASQNRTTSFSSTFSTQSNSTSTECDYQKVFNYARYVPAINKGADIVLKPDGNVLSGAITDLNNVINKSIVIMVINDRRYAGTCVMYPQGACIGMCPMSVNSNPQYAFEATLRHEVGGHGFGKFVDEYIYSNETIPASGAGYNTGNITTWQTQLGYYQNISLSDDKAKAPAIWQNFYSDAASYPEVGMYEGSCTFAKGVWRSESNSIMNNNVDYYSGVCRYFIYSQIKKIVGEPYSFAAFKTKDKQPSPAQMQVMSAKAVSGDKFIPLGPPIMMDMP